MSRHLPITLDSEHLGLLQSIIDITRHSERCAMEKALVAALATHTPCETITFIPRPFSAEVPLAGLVKLDVACFQCNAEQGWHFDLDVGGIRALVSRAFFDGMPQTEIVQRRQLIAIPLIEAGQTSAVLVFECSREQVISLDIVHALLNIYQNHLNILRESESDKLTGLLNRRTFDSKFQHLVAQQTAQVQSTYSAVGGHQRQHQPQDHSWLGIIDIDYFKKINDEYGHIYGDEILLLLSRQMQDFFRRADLLFRFGGEEFVVLLEPTNEDGAEIAFSRFVSQVASYDFPQVGKVTISVGFAPIYPNSVSTEVFGRADQALYYAKEHGRNQVASYLELLDDGRLSSLTTGENIDLF